MNKAVVAIKTRRWFVVVAGVVASKDVVSFLGDSCSTARPFSVSYPASFQPGT
jgi:hypothetical protein